MNTKTKIILVAILIALLVMPFTFGIARHKIGTQGGGGGGNFVPYTGATQDVDLGDKDLSTKNLTVTGFTSIGFGHLISGTNNHAFGRDCTMSGTDNLCFGTNYFNLFPSYAHGTGSIAMGIDAYTNANAGLAVGAGANTTGNFGIAIGDAQVTAQNGIGISGIAGNNCVSIDGQCHGSNSVSIGVNARTYNIAGNNRQVAIMGRATGQDAVAIGTGVNAYADKTVAIGTGNINNTVENSFAIGGEVNTTVPATNQIVFHYEFEKGLFIGTDASAPHTITMDRDDVYFNDTVEIAGDLHVDAIIMQSPNGSEYTCSVANGGAFSCS